MFSFRKRFIYLSLLVPIFASVSKHILYVLSVTKLVLLLRFMDLIKLVGRGGARRNILRPPLKTDMVTLCKVSSTFFHHTYMHFKIKISIYHIIKISI